MNTPASLYACVRVAHFPAQALLRLRADLKSVPVVVLDGRPPQERVCSFNRHARLHGAAEGITRLECEAIPGMQMLRRCADTERATRSVLMECVARFSPRIEEVTAPAACIFVLDIAGSERLFGTPKEMAVRLRASLAETGLRASVGVSASFDTACMAAASTNGISVIAEGQEADALSRLSISTLCMPDHARETFAMWGIRTLGELAALPEVELITRLGQEGRMWRQAACGALPHMFQPIEPEFQLREYCRFEDAVEEIDSLLFMGARMLQAIVSRAAGRALSVASVTVRMALEGNQMHERVLKPAVPSSDARFLLKLLQLDVAAHPPQAAVVSVEMCAEAGHCGTAQMGLFVPQTPEPSRLDVTLARIKALVGEDRVGAPVLEDTHHPGAFHMESFTSAEAAEHVAASRPRMVLRRMRPPLPVRVQLHHLQPCAFRDGTGFFEVQSAYGPWKTNGCWWSADAWNLEEWDVLAQRRDGPQVACLLVHDAVSDAWRLEAVYD